MLSKEEYLEKNKVQLALDYFEYCCNTVDPKKLTFSINDFLDSQYESYVNADKKKNAKPGQTLAEAFGVSPDTGLRIDDIPMKSVSRDYVTLEKMINVNNKLINVQIRFNYKDLL